MRRTILLLIALTCGCLNDPSTDSTPLAKSGIIAPIPKLEQLGTGLSNDQLLIEEANARKLHAAAEARDSAIRRRKVLRAQSLSVASISADNQGDVWWQLAGCETGGRYDAVGYHYTGNGYWGFFQFSLGTWRSVGGTGRPTDHSYETQKQFAIKLQQRSGWGQWLRCSKILGLR